MNTAYRIDVIARASVLYHRRRQAWLERWDVLAKLLAIFSSAAVVYSDKYGITPLAVTVASATALLTIWVVVTGANRKALLHSSLATRWSELLIDVFRAGEDPSKLQPVQEKMVQIIRDEPAELGAQVRLCMAEILRADGVPEIEIPTVSTWQSWWANWYDFNTPPNTTAK